MKCNFFKLIALILTIAMLLTGCGYGGGQTDSSEAPEETSDGAADGKAEKFTAITAQPGTVTNPSDDVFTVCWISSEPLNPFAVVCGENEAVLPLMYEGLFSISPTFEAEPVICSDYAVFGRTYIFNINSDITFHNGLSVTAKDVVYSIKYAMESERFALRLACIENVNYVNDSRLTVTVKTENATLPLLLDIPIVQDGTGDNAIPMGTGPYMFRQGDSVTGAHLSAYDDYREKLPVSEIYLHDISNKKPATALSERDVDLILYDPLSSSLDVYIDHETHYYNTTILEYVGFNTHNYILNDSDVRRAIGHMINRENAMSGAPGGSCVLSPLVLSPASPGYDDSLEEQNVYSPQIFSEILNEKNVSDDNRDSWLEYRGGTMAFKLVVCDADKYNVEAADSIAKALRSIGVRVTLEALPYTEYIEAIETGSYDMYYAQVRLTSNFDLSEILGSEGTLNFSGYSDYDDLLANYLKADSDEKKTTASQELCQAVYDNAPIIPICYKNNAVVVPRNEVTGLNPSQQNLFWNITSWSIKF